MLCQIKVRNSFRNRDGAAPVAAIAIIIIGLKISGVCPHGHIAHGQGQLNNIIRICYTLVNLPLRFTVNRISPPPADYEAYIIFRIMLPSRLDNNSSCQNSEVQTPSVMLSSNFMRMRCGKQSKTCWLYFIEQLGRVYGSQHCSQLVAFPAHSNAV